MPTPATRRIVATPALLAALLAALLLATAAGAAAQVAKAPPKPPPKPPARALARALSGCSGQMVSAVEVRAHRPSAVGAAAEVRDKAFEISGMHYATTREHVVRAYLQVREGRVCTERKLRESERLLRALPFIASAAIRVAIDSDGLVKLMVDVVDEVPLIVGGSVSHGTVSSLVVGSQNFGGRGLFTALSLERGFAYRSGAGVRAVQYGAFGRPDLIALEAAREPHGDRLVVEVAEPFLTELQRHALHVSVGSASGFTDLVPPSGDAVALFARRAFWDAGAVARLGAPAAGRTVGVVGALVMGEDIRTGGGVVIISDSGLVPAPDTALENRYPAYGVARVAVIAGVRHLQYLTVAGFDALEAEQDVGHGVQLGVLAGPSVWASRGKGDLFAAADLYAGTGNDRSFLAARLLAEGRVNRASRSRNGMVSSAHVAWYRRSSERWATSATLDAAALRDLPFPAQLSLRDADGGVRGFGGAAASGSGRAVVRLEQRLGLPSVSARAATAIAFFADAGKLWAGDAPYALSTPVRRALGVSLLGAYPSTGKRTYRLDVAVPLNPARGDSKFEIRLSSSDRTGRIWNEPRDVAFTRTSAMPATLLKW